MRRPLAGTAAPFLLASLLVSAAALILPVAPAWAEDKTAARDHWERGTKFYDLGKYDDAIREFEAAYEAKGDPAFLYNLAQSHRLAGHPNDSLRFYRTYLRYVPKAPNRADIEGRIKELEKIVAERPATEPSITTPPATNAPGTTGGPTVPPPGGGPTTSFPPVGLPPSSGPGSSGSSGNSGMIGGAPPGGPGSAPGDAPPPHGGPVPPPETQPPFPGPSPTEPLPVAQKSSRRTVGITVAAIGGGVFVVGGIFGLVARSQSKKVEEADRFDPSVESLGKTSETLQWIGYGLGAAAVITGVIVYATAPTETAAPPQVAVAPLVGPGSGGALLRVSF